MAIDYQRYIVRDPGICGGEPIVKGTRVTVRTILASLAEGLSVEAIMGEFLTLDEAAVREGHRFRCGVGRRRSADTRRSFGCMKVKLTETSTSTSRCPSPAGA